LSLIDARPLKEGKGADRGVDGLLFYYETERKDLLNRIREDAPVMHGSRSTALAGDFNGLG
jgi:hypothetical protein